MEQIITLEKYFELGGLLEKLDLKNTSMNYGSYPSQPIAKIEEAGMNLSETNRIYRVYFNDGSSSTFSGIYINTKIYLSLERRYLPVKLEDHSFTMLSMLEEVLRLKNLIEYSGIIPEEHMGEAQAVNSMINGIDNFVKSVK